MWWLGTARGRPLGICRRCWTKPPPISPVARPATASSAQSGMPSSVEPTLRPGLARQVAMKRGREAVAIRRNNPETRCWWNEHYRSLISNGCWLVPWDEGVPLNKRMTDLDARWRAELLRQAAQEWPHSSLEQHLAIAEALEPTLKASRLKLSIVWDDCKKVLCEWMKS